MERPQKCKTECTQTLANRKGPVLTLKVDVSSAIPFLSKREVPFYGPCGSGALKRNAEFSPLLPMEMSFFPKLFPVAVVLSWNKVLFQVKSFSGWLIRVE